MYRRKTRSSASPRAVAPRQVQRGLAAVIDGVGEYLAPAPPPMNDDRLDRLIQLMEQQQQGWFYKLTHRPFVALMMFITGTLLVVACAYLYHGAILKGCQYAEKQLTDAIYRHDYGSMELYSQQVGRLCSLNNKMRVAVFDHFGKFVDGFSPAGLIQQILSGAFGWIAL